MAPSTCWADGVTACGLATPPPRPSGEINGPGIRDGMAEIVDTKDVDESEIYVHNIYEENPSIAFSLSRLSHGPYGPTPLGIFRKVQRDSFTEEVHGQIENAKEQKGEGDVDKLIRSLGTWDVG